MKYLIFLLCLVVAAATGRSQTNARSVMHVNGVVVSPTNFWANAPAATNVSFSTNPTFQSVAVADGSATNYAVKIGTNTGLYRQTGPDRLVLSVAGATTVYALSNSFYATTFFGNLQGGLTISAGQSIVFGGGANIAGTRTNLGLGATWLTNTNVVNFRTAIGAGTVNEGTAPTFAEIDIASQGDSLNLSPYGFSGWGMFLSLEERLLSYGSSTGDVWTFSSGIAFQNQGAGVTRTNLGLTLVALTSTSNVQMMRSLAGVTNGPISGVFPAAEITQLTVSNGIIVGMQTNGVNVVTP